MRAQMLVDFASSNFVEFIETFQLNTLLSEEYFLKRIFDSLNVKDYCQAAKIVL
jgi:hypothetical protein